MLKTSTFKDSLSEPPVVILGGGIIGLCCAAVLNQAGIACQVIESKAAPTLPLAARPFVSALNEASAAILSHLGIWQLLPPQAIGKIKKMCVGTENTPKQLTLQTTQAPPMAYVVDNAQLKQLLWSHCHQAPLITLCDKVTACKLTPDFSTTRRYTLELSDTSQRRPQLIIGADGPRSWLRNHICPHWQQRPYHQSAVVAEIRHTHAHLQTAYQQFNETGPMALLPSHEPHQSFLIWSTQHTIAHTLTHSDDNAFNCMLMNAWGDSLGSLTKTSAAYKHPLCYNHVPQWVRPGLALIGDAAHTFHPLAGQGANLGLQDVLALVGHLLRSKESGHDLGHIRYLKNYSRQRRAQITGMVRTINTLNGLFSNDDLLYKAVRSRGFALANRCSWLKKYLVDQASGKRASQKNTWLT